MNLIYLHTHDTGRYLSPYGHAVPTPSLQAFAREAALFRNNYCCGPTCSPSRSAMLTGMHAHHNGMMGLAHRGFSIFDYGKHLAQYLRRQGYETMLCGMQHEAAEAKTLGYERLYIHDKAKVQNATQWDMKNGDAAIDFLREKHDRPFFLSYGLEHTHRPFEELDADMDARYLCPPAPLPDVPEVRGDYAGFLTSARRADACLGRVLDVIGSRNLWEDTVVLYTTDHGIAFPWMKCNLFDTGIGTAMMLRYPHNPSAGRAIDALTSHLDVFPTLCDLLGLEKPKWLEGVSLLPLLEGRRQTAREEVFAQVLYHAAYEPQIAVRTERFKYIRRFDDTARGEHSKIVSHKGIPTGIPTARGEHSKIVSHKGIPTGIPTARGEHSKIASHKGIPTGIPTARGEHSKIGIPTASRPVMSNIDAGPSKDYLLSQGLAEVTLPREMLFDLTMDPGERNNVAEDPAYRTALFEMRGRLDAFMREGDHPLLRGRLPLPPGAFALKPNVLDAEDIGNPENLIRGS